MSQDELSWLAFCYVAGELNDEEIASFEVLLTEDQSAREAVEEAVALLEVVGLALAPSPVTPRRSVGRTIHSPIAWATATAAGLLLAWIVYEIARPDGRPEPRLVEKVQVDPTNASQNGAELASAWTRVRQIQTSELDIVGEPMETIAEFNQGADIQAAPAIPQWLLTAVAAEGQRPKEKP